MNESKLKHSYSLTSLSSRFLSHNNHNHSNYTNGNGNSNNFSTHTINGLSNGLSRFDECDQPPPQSSDDYGFLSYRDRSGIGGGEYISSSNSTKNSSASSSGNNALNKSNALYSSYYTNSGSKNASSIANRQQLPRSCKKMNSSTSSSNCSCSPSVPCTCDSQHNSSHSYYNNGKGNATTTTTSNSISNNNSNNIKKFGEINTTTSLISTPSNILNVSTTTNERSGGGNNLNGFGHRLSSTNMKLNASCQALNGYSNGTSTNNICSNSINYSNSMLSNNTTNNGYKHSSNNNGTNGTCTAVNASVTTATTNGNSKPNSAVRVRRTLSCYVKNPQSNNISTTATTTSSTANNNGFKLLSDSSSRLTIAEKELINDNGGGTTATATLSHSFNPICEFSPYSSLSSNDLLRVGTGTTTHGLGGFGYNGYDRRCSETSVFFHDNPVDCGCPTCFQVKLSIFKTTQKKQSPPGLTNGTTNKENGSNNKEESSTVPLPLSYSTYSNTTSKNVESDIQWPLTPEEAVGYFSSRLTSWELQEISKFPQIWYVGHDVARKNNGDKTNPLNCGFDDENGNYHKVTRDHLAYRFEILEVIGKGSFGQVIRATDHKTHSQVAIKIIRNKKRFHQQALVEVKILEHIRKRDHDNTVIRMYSSFYFRNHLCIVFELMSLNLYELIRRNHYQGFSTGLIRKFAVSLLKCLALLKKENIIHCDLKPENILLRKRGSSAIKVIDLGSSCFGHERVFSYIQSRFYRAPEVILGVPYTTAIDIWSLGCVLAELATGYPLFPGENEVEQLACIMETLGMPQDGLITVATRRRLFFDSRNQPRCIRNSKGRVRRPASRDLAVCIKSADLDFISFLRKCLTWDANDRITPEEGLNHPWITSATIQNTIVRKNYV